LLTWRVEATEPGSYHEDSVSYGDELAFSARGGNVVHCADLLDAGHNPAANGAAALHWACERGHELVVRRLLLDSRLLRGDTGGRCGKSAVSEALLTACAAGHAGIVHALLANGAQLDVRLPFSCMNSLLRGSAVYAGMFHHQSVDCEQWGDYLADGLVFLSNHARELEGEVGLMILQSLDDDLQEARDGDLQAAPDGDLHEWLDDELQAAPDGECQGTLDDDLQALRDDDFQAVPDDDLQEALDDALQEAPDGDLQEALNNDLQEAPDDDLHQPAWIPSVSSRCGGFVSCALGVATLRGFTDVIKVLLEHAGVHVANGDFAIVAALLAGHTSAAYRLLEFFYPCETASQSRLRDTDPIFHALLYYATCMGGDTDLMRIVVQRDPSLIDTRPVSRWLGRTGVGLAATWKNPAVVRFLLSFPTVLDACADFKPGRHVLEAARDGATNAGCWLDSLAGLWDTWIDPWGISLGLDP